MANIFIFGDSITYGCWDEQGGWAFRIKNSIENKIIASNFTIDHFVYPLGIPGDQTKDVVYRFRSEVEKRHVSTEKTIFLFAIGINDSSYCHATKSFSTPLSQFQENISQLITLAKTYTDTFAFIGLTPVDEIKVDPMPWYPGESYRNEFIKQYDEALQHICKKENISFIPIFQDWIKGDYKTLLTDGVHPNTEGHKLLFERIIKEVGCWIVEDR